MIKINIILLHCTVHSTNYAQTESTIVIIRIIVKNTIIIIIKLNFVSRFDFPETSIEHVPHTLTIRVNSSNVASLYHTQ